MNDDNMQWESYSKLVLAELARLNQNITYLMEELQSLKSDMTELKVKEDAVKELKKWKDTVDDIASPSRIKKIVSDVDDLKSFKVQAVTIWIVVQTIFGILIAFLKLNKS